MALYKLNSYFCNNRKITFLLLTTSKTFFLDSFYNELNYDKQMKSSTLITILATFLLVGCSKQQSTLDKQLDEVEKIIEVNPDSASSILET